ncbi:MAG: hypothetical protein ACI398_04145 [Clostridium sp.]
MKKFVRTDTNEEVSFGDMIIVTRKTPYSISTYGTTLTEYNYEEFILMGIIKELTETSDPYQHLANRMNWSIKDCTKFVEILTEVCPKAAFTLMLSEMSEMEEKYKADKIWIISSISGKIRCIDTPETTKGFSYFMSKESAERAKNTLKPLYNLVFNE